MTASNINRFARWAMGYERDGLAPMLSALRADGYVRLGVTDKDRFLDVGCATGGAVRQAARGAVSAVGVDLSMPMVIQAARLGAGQESVHVLGRRLAAFRIRILQLPAVHVCVASLR
ncbi:class I SAM-dependent methyltransferase [Nonomuraea sp. NPDC050022]|uniref:class I SAM-dependent methyltransferase n=1 Tax=Nonomuraea sp. NPDC050022 TaxID=3364358 RepID=UPI0037B781F3